MSLKKEPFDPKKLVDLASQQFPSDSWLPEALANCTVGWWESRAYVYFVNPNLESTNLKSHETILLEHSSKGDIVLDISKDQEIIGAEFLKLI